MDFFKKNGELVDDAKEMHQAWMERIGSMRRTSEKAGRFKEKERKFIEDLDNVGKRMVNALRGIEEQNFLSFDESTIRKNGEKLLKFVDRDIHDHPHQRYFDPHKVREVHATFMQAALKEGENVKLAIDWKQFKADFVEYILKPLFRYLDDLREDFNRESSTIDRELQLLNLEKSAADRLA